MKVHEYDTCACTACSTVRAKRQADVTVVLSRSVAEEARDWLEDAVADPETDAAGMRLLLALMQGLDK